MKQRTLAVLIAAAILSSSSLSYAKGNIKLGLIEVHPYLGITAVQDDNIYQVQSSLKPKSDMIATITPGIGLTLPNDLTQFKFDAHSDAQNYTTVSTNNVTNTYIDLMYNQQFPFGLSFGIKGGYKDTTDPLTSELTERTKRTQTDAKLDLVYKFGEHFGIGVNAGSTVHDYAKQEMKDILNRTESANGGSLLYFISPKTSLLINVSMNAVVYKYFKYVDITDPTIFYSNDSKSTNIELGIKGTITPKTAGVITVGQTARTYDTIKNKDITTSILTFATGTKFTEKTTLKLLISRGLMETNFGDTPTVPGNLYYTATMFNIDLSQKLCQKFGIGIQVGAETDDYPKEATAGTLTALRTDTLNNAGLNIGYDITDWFNAGITYSMKGRNSNFDAFDYSKNIVGITLKTSW